MSALTACPRMAGSAKDCSELSEVAEMSLFEESGPVRARDSKSPGINISNIGFHAPPQEPGWANDGTYNNQGYSSTPWAVTQASDSITWNCETFAQNPNTNAVRWGTLYNFRFDADQAPNPTDATVGFFKTGSPIGVVIQAPGNVPAPSPTATATATSTPTPTSTPAPGPSQSPRARPSPMPRPVSPGDQLSVISKLNDTF